MVYIMLRMMKIWVYGSAELMTPKDTTHDIDTVDAASSG